MELNENARNQEAGFSFPSGWRRDSARRLPLRSTGFSVRRGLSPRWGSETGIVEPVGAIDWAKEDRMTTMTMLFLAIGALSCCRQVAYGRTAVVMRRPAGASMPRVQ